MQSKLRSLTLEHKQIFMAIPTKLANPGNSGALRSQTSLPFLHTLQDESFYLLFLTKLKILYMYK